MPARTRTAPTSNGSQRENSNIPRSSTCSSEVELGSCTEETQNSPTPNLSAAIRLNENIHSRRQKWTMEDYKEIMWCHLYVSITTLTCNMKMTFELWRKRNPNMRLNMDANKLANQRRYIIKSNKLTVDELHLIEENVRLEVSRDDGVQDTDGEVEDRDQDPTNTSMPAITSLNLERSRVSAALSGRRRVEISVGSDQVGEEEIEDGDQDPTNGSLPLLSPSQEVLDDVLHSDLEEEIMERWRQLKTELTWSRAKLPKLKITKQSKKVVFEVNSALEKIAQANEHITLSDINILIYAAAQTVLKNIGYEMKENAGQRRKNDLKWKKRIQHQIDEWRREISRITDIQQTKSLSIKQQAIKAKLESKYNIASADDLTRVKEILKQKIQAKAQRVRRYKKRVLQYQQNKQFNEGAKSFYRNILNKQIDVKNHPPIEDVEQFWKGIWEDNKQHNHEAPWIESLKEENSTIPEMEWRDITALEVSKQLKRAANWKAPGLDGVQNFWLKSFTKLHCRIADAYNNVIRDPESVPAWLTQGRTYLLPKSNDTQLPKNYRPITCLSTMYKNLTAIISSRMHTFFDQHNIMPKEQKGCSSGSFGCKDHLMLSKAIMDDCKRNKKNLQMGWIDYKKAFDSVPHSWILKAMSIYRLNPQLIRFCQSVMTTWRTSLILRTENEVITSEYISIKRGIYQGDSLSPLLFCMSLFPLSSMLNKSRCGYMVKNTDVRVNHLIYMDDIKIFGQRREDMEEMIGIVKRFSDDICMEFGLEKCATASFKKGKISTSANITVENNCSIKTLEPGEAYKYLGIDEGDGIQHVAMKDKLVQEYRRRVRLILQTELNGRNKILAIGALAVPVLQYSFCILDWTLKELKDIDRKTRKLLTIHKMHHPRADVQRLYVSRKQGGRGLCQVEGAYKTAMIGTAEYIRLKENDKFVNTIKVSDQNRPKTLSLLLIADKCKSNINMTNIHAIIDKGVLHQVRKVREIVKSKLQDQLCDEWEGKAMHGQYPKDMKNVCIDRTSTFNWLVKGALKGETESLIVAAQDQTLRTRSYEKRILKTGSNGMCRLCKEYEETIAHIVSGCPVLARKEYIARHDKIAASLHWAICHYFNLPKSKNHYDHQPPQVCDNGEVTVIWNEQVQTDRTILANKPDIIIKDLKENTCLIIDVAVPMDVNVQRKESEKILKYRDLQIEIGRMWNLRTKVCPIVIGALGTVSKHHQDFASMIPGQFSTSDLQKHALLGSAYIIRRVIT